jgi:RNase P subunit RPR2
MNRYCKKCDSLVTPIPSTKGFGRTTKFGRALPDWYDCLKCGKVHVARTDSNVQKHRDKILKKIL